MDFTERAEALLKDRELDALTAFCQDNMDHPAAPRMLGKALFLQGCFREAANCLEVHLSRAPDDAPSWHRYVQALSKSGSPGAHDALAQALAHCPNDMGLALERARQLSMAGRELEALQRLPAKAPPLFRFNLQRRLGLNDDAIRDGIEALSNAYDNALASQLVDLLLETGRFDEAHALAGDRSPMPSLRIPHAEAQGVEMAPACFGDEIASMIALVEHHQINVVDVGARGGDLGPLSTFAPVLDYIAFEPEPRARESLARAAQFRAPWRSVTILPNALGAADCEGTLFVTQKGGLSSTLRPNPMTFAGVGMSDRAKIVAETPIRMTALDRLVECSKCPAPDILKLDVQGGELAILKGAETALSRAGAVFVEAEFRAFYDSQPLFADIDLHLRERGFSLIDMDVSRMADVSDSSEYARRRPVWTHALYVVEKEHGIEDTRRGLSAITALIGFYHFAEAITMVEAVYPEHPELANAVRGFRSAAAQQVSIARLNSAKQMALPPLTVIWESQRRG